MSSVASISQHAPNVRALEMLEHCDIANVRVTKLTAEVFDTGYQTTRVEIEQETSYLVNAGQMANKFEWAVKIFDSQDGLAAELLSTIILEYRLDEDFEPDSDAASDIAASVGLMAVYPYAREVFESQTSRLQMDPIVLGLLRSSDMRTRSVSGVKRL